MRSKLATLASCFLAYATSEVTVSSDRIASWDRGYDQAGSQVWGAEKAAYVFDRIELND